MQAECQNLQRRYSLSHRPGIILDCGTALATRNLTTFIGLYLNRGTPIVRGAFFIPGMGRGEYLVNI